MLYGRGFEVEDKECRVRRISKVQTGDGSSERPPQAPPSTSPISRRITRYITASWRLDNRKTLFSSQHSFPAPSYCNFPSCLHYFVIIGSADQRHGPRPTFRTKLVSSDVRDPLTRWLVDVPGFQFGFKSRLFSSFSSFSVNLPQGRGAWTVSLCRHRS